MLHFRIQLAKITQPPVWRKVTVPANFSFARFHLVIQRAFGWYYCHLYQFSEKGYDSDVFIGEPSHDDFDEVKDSYKIKLSKVFRKKGRKYIYIYDFGDDWKHIITLEDITESDEENADCIAGKGACPPEDCGGPWGYKQLKETLADIKHPGHASMREWLGLAKSQPWNAAAFDLEATKKAVREV